MRRISARYAKPTMLLGRSLYDSYGRVIMKEGTKLSAHHVSSLEELGVGELFIRDKRADDVVIWPLITPELEGSLAISVRQALRKAQSIVSHGKAQTLDLAQIREGIFEMMQQLFPAAMGEPAVTGCYATKEYDFAHPVKVAGLALLLGQAAGLPQAELVNLGVAALLQNIGYAAMPQGFVDKEGPLTQAEIQVVQRHPAMGAEIIKRYGQVAEEIATMVQQHHERWNGSGYPAGLKGTGICLGARALGIADSAVALASIRPHHGRILAENAPEYANAFTGDHGGSSFLKPHEAKEFVVAYSGELFDPGLVKIFTRQIPTYPKGIMVRLNSGEAGIVSGTDAGGAFRPRVRLCYDRELRELDQPIDIDLAAASYQGKLVTEVMEY